MNAQDEIRRMCEKQNCYYVQDCMEIIYQSLKEAIAEIDGLKIRDENIDPEEEFVNERLRTAIKILQKHFGGKEK